MVNPSETTEDRRDEHVPERVARARRVSLWRADLGRRPVVPRYRGPGPRAITSRSKPTTGWSSRTDFVEFLPCRRFFINGSLQFLFNALRAFVLGLNLGEVLFTGVRVRLWPGKFREPDVLFMHAEHADRMTDEYWEGADLVMEVVSSGDEDRRRDLKTKREEYAQAGIPEYWIVDPELEQITVLTLDGQTYVVHGEFKRGEQATSKLLPGFAVDVAAALTPKTVNDGRIAFAWVTGGGGCYLAASGRASLSVARWCVAVVFRRASRPGRGAVRARGRRRSRGRGEGLVRPRGGRRPACGRPPGPGPGCSKHRRGWAAGGRLRGNRRPLVRNAGARDERGRGDCGPRRSRAPARRRGPVATAPGPAGFATTGWPRCSG